MKNILPCARAEFVRVIGGCLLLGTGVDIVDVARLKACVERRGEKLLRRLFTAAEIELCLRRRHAAFERLAARFAVKEAVLKALGFGLRGVRWTEIEVLNDESGCPSVRLRGRAQELARARRVGRLVVSASHCPAYAVGQAIAVGEGVGHP